MLGNRRWDASRKCIEWTELILECGWQMNARQKNFSSQRRLCYAMLCERLKILNELQRVAILRVRYGLLLFVALYTANSASCVIAASSSVYDYYHAELISENPRLVYSLCHTVT